MAGLSGRGGKITYASGAVAEIGNWTMSDDIDVIEDTAMSNGATSLAKTFIQGNSNKKVQLSGSYDPADSDGQVAMMAATGAANLVLYPEGDGSGKKYWTGSALRTGFQVAGEVNGKINFSASFQFSGTVSYSTV
jgi:hypothetical protein